MELPALRPDQRAAVRLAARLAQARLNGELQGSGDPFEAAQILEGLDDGVAVLFDEAGGFVITIDGELLDSAVVLQAAAYLALALASVGSQATGQDPDQLLEGLVAIASGARISA